MASAAPDPADIIRSEYVQFNDLLVASPHVQSATIACFKKLLVALTDDPNKYDHYNRYCLLPSANARGRELVDILRWYQRFGPEATRNGFMCFLAQTLLGFLGPLLAPDSREQIMPVLTDTLVLVSQELENSDYSLEAKGVLFNSLSMLFPHLTPARLWASWEWIRLFPTQYPDYWRAPPPLTRFNVLTSWCRCVTSIWEVVPPPYTHALPFEMLPETWKNSMVFLAEAWADSSAPQLQGGPIDRENALVDILGAAATLCKISAPIRTSLSKGRERETALRMLTTFMKLPDGRPKVAQLSLFLAIFRVVPYVPASSQWYVFRNEDFSTILENLRCPDLERGYAVNKLVLDVFIEVPMEEGLLGELAQYVMRSEMPKYSGSPLAVVRYRGDCLRCVTNLLSRLPVREVSAPDKPYWNHIPSFINVSVSHMLHCAESPNLGWTTLAEYYKTVLDTVNAALLLLQQVARTPPDRYMSLFVRGTFLVSFTEVCAKNYRLFLFLSRAGVRRDLEDAWSPLYTQYIQLLKATNSFADTWNDPIPDGPDTKRTKFGVFFDYIFDNSFILRCIDSGNWEPLMLCLALSAQMQRLSGRRYEVWEDINTSLFTHEWTNLVPVDEEYRYLTVLNRNACKPISACSSTQQKGVHFLEMLLIGTRWPYLHNVTGEDAKARKRERLDALRSLIGMGVRNYITVTKGWDVAKGAPGTAGFEYFKGVGVFLAEVIMAQQLEPMKKKVLRVFFQVLFNESPYLCIGKSKKGGGEEEEATINNIFEGIQAGLGGLFERPQFYRLLLKELGRKGEFLVRSLNLGQNILPTLLVVWLLRTLPRNEFAELMQGASRDIYDTLGCSLTLEGNPVVMNAFFRWTLRHWDLVLAAIPEVISAKAVEITLLPKLLICVEVLEDVYTYSMDIAEERRIVTAFILNYYIGYGNRDLKKVINNPPTALIHGRVVLHIRILQQQLDLVDIPLEEQEREVFSYALQAFAAAQAHYGDWEAPLQMVDFSWFLINAMNAILAQPQVCPGFYYNIFVHLCTHHPTFNELPSQDLVVDILVRLRPIDIFHAIEDLPGVKLLSKYEKLTVILEAYARAVPFVNATEAHVRNTVRRNIGEFAREFMAEYRALLAPGLVGFRSEVVELRGVRSMVAVLFELVYDENGGDENARETEQLLPLALHYSLSPPYIQDGHEDEMGMERALGIMRRHLRAAVGRLDLGWLFESHLYPEAAVRQYVLHVTECAENVPEDRRMALDKMTWLEQTDIYRGMLEAQLRGADDAAVGGAAARITEIEAAETAWNTLSEMGVQLQALLRPPPVDPGRMSRDPVYRASAIAAVREFQTSQLITVVSEIRTALDGCGAFEELKNYRALKQKEGRCWFEECNSVADNMCHHCHNIFCGQCIVTASNGAYEGGIEVGALGKPHCFACNTVLGAYDHGAAVGPQAIAFFKQFRPNFQFVAPPVDEFNEEDWVLGNAVIIPHRRCFNAAALGNLKSPRPIVTKLLALVDEQKVALEMGSQKRVALEAIITRLGDLLRSLPEERLEAAGRKRSHGAAAVGAKGAKFPNGGEVVKLTTALERVCGFKPCGKEFGKGEGGGACAHCMRVAYCSRDCQASDLQRHAPHCTQFHY